MNRTHILKSTKKFNSDELVPFLGNQFPFNSIIKWKVYNVGETYFIESSGHILESLEKKRVYKGIFAPVYDLPKDVEFVNSNH